MSRASSRCWRWSSPTGTRVGVVGEDVGGHQHRVVEQPDAHRLLALGLLLELGHPPQLAEGGDAVEDPGELGVRGHVALHEQRAALRVEPGGEQEHRGAAGAGRRSSAASYGQRHRVEVDDAVERLVGRVGLRPGPRPSAARRRGSCRGASRRWAGCPRSTRGMGRDTTRAVRRPRGCSRCHDRRAAAPVRLELRWRTRSARRSSRARSTSSCT